MADDLADDRWTVRGVPKGMREAASEAAARGKVTVGAWLCRAIDREVAAEREPFGLVLPPADKSSDAEARLAMVERAVASAVALASAPGVPTGFRRRANKLLRESLPASGAARPTPGFVAVENGQVADGTVRH
jgi:hypothetical protein